MTRIINVVVTQAAAAVADVGDGVETTTGKAEVLDRVYDHATQRYTFEASGVEVNFENDFNDEAAVGQFLRLGQEDDGVWSILAWLCS